MKKLLALVLALVMSMSLVTISNAADFSDAKDIDYKEAVDVLAAVGVLEGSDGKFDPKAELTREQAAKIIAYLDLGKDVAEALPAVKVFNDVEASRWSAKFIAYCADAGYIAGVGNGNFDPTGKLTGYAFGKMLLCALGYDAAIEEFTGSAWTIKVAKLMESNSLTKGTSKLGSAVLTREEAAQYALNALKATTVEYDEKGSTITAGDVTIITGAKKANAVTTEESYGTALKTEYQADGTTPVTKQSVQLGEKLYKGDLTYGATGSDTEDTFGRPCKTWEYKKEAVASNADSAVAVFNGATSADDVYKALKGYSVRTSASTTAKIDNTNNATAITVTFDPADGTETFTVNTSATVAKNFADLTKNGKAVEFYANDNKVITEIVTISYGVGEVSVSSSKTQTSYAVTGYTGVDFVDPDKKDTVVLAGAVADEDIVTFVKPAGSTKLYIYPTTKVVGAQSEFNAAKETIVVGSTTYKVGTGVYDADASASVAVPGNSTDEANYYLDQFGYVVKTTAITETKYAVVNAIAVVAGLTDTVSAELVFTDGTTKTVTVKDVVVGSNKYSTSGVTIDSSASGTNSKALAGEIYTYTVDDNGKYTLTQEGTHGKIALSTAVDVAIKGNPVVGNSTTATIGDSTIVVVKTKDGADTKFTAYTGYKAMPTVKAKAVTDSVVWDYAAKTSGVKFVYIDATLALSVEDNSSTAKYAYVTSAKYSTKAVSSTKTVYVYSAVIDGENTTLTTNSDIYAINNDVVGMYKISSVDKNGYANISRSDIQNTTYTATGYTQYGSFTASSGNDAKDGVLKLGSVNYTYTGDETVVVIDKDGNASAGKMAGVKPSTNYTTTLAVYVKEVANTTTHEIDTVYVIEK